MKITIAKTESEFDRIAAWRIINKILADPKAVIGLATGQTTKNMHLIIAEIYKMYPFDVSNITFSGLDEVTNIPRENGWACYTKLKNQLLGSLGIKDENFIIPPTKSDDFEKECRLFENALAERGGVDLQIVGLGTNGHIGFNQPGTSFESNAWLSTMDENLEARIRKEIDIPAETKLGGITLGIKNIMHSKKIILVAKGESKAEIVKKMLYGPVTTDVPASILQLHPNCEFLLNAEAAKEI